MIVVSDTTAITSLLKIGQANLLQELFTEVFAPIAVRNELLKFHPNLPAFLKLRAIADRDAVGLLVVDIDLGEAEAIILAEELRADALLIDEKQGRSIAERRGLRCLGLAGALLMAKENGLITNLHSVLQALERDANFYLDEGIKKLLLKRANEIT